MFINNKKHMKNEEKKTALKLLSKYADSYNILKDENKHLRAEIVDIKTNLKINKEIIHGFFQHNNIDDQNNFYLSKLKEENITLNTQIEKAQKEKEEIRNKV